MFQRIHVVLNFREKYRIFHLASQCVTFPKGTGIYFIQRMQFILFWMFRSLALWMTFFPLHCHCSGWQYFYVCNKYKKCQTESRSSAVHMISQTPEIQNNLLTYIHSWHLIWEMRSVKRVENKACEKCWMPSKYVDK